jgi:putative ABC transport system permease protein
MNLFSNYLKMAWRNLTKQMVLAMINITGLSVGLACFILFLFYAMEEFHFDGFHQHAKSIYRVYLWSEPMNGKDAEAQVHLPSPAGQAMKQDLPFVEDFVRFSFLSECYYKRGNIVGREKVTLTDPQIFSVFSFKLLKGDYSTALKDLHDVVLTKTVAEKIFGKEDPVGKVIQIKVIDAFEPFTVTAIADDPPAYSTIQFSILGNFNYFNTTSFGPIINNNWNASGFQVFIRTKTEDLSAAELQSLTAFRKKYYPDEEAGARETGWKGKGDPFSFRLQRLTDMHTDINITGEGVEPVDPKNIWLLLSIAAGVLLIACINFTTLSIGRSVARSKEVGIRKVVGSSRKSLILLFLSEVLLLTIIAEFLAVAMLFLLIPFFNELTGRDMNLLNILANPQILGMLVGLIVVVSFLAGSYPAWVLSAFSPVKAIKAKIRLNGSNIFTKVLVTLQFVLSMALIIGTVVIIQQLNYMRGKNPGFNKQNVIVVDASGLDTKTIYPLFRNAMLREPGVAGITASQIGIGQGEGAYVQSFKYNNKDIKYLNDYFIDPSYITVLGMQLLRGRDFSPTTTADTVTSVIVNEAMVKDFGWSIDNAVGQRLIGYNSPNIPVVVGVVRNVNFFSMTENIKPQMFHQFQTYQPNKFFIRVLPGTQEKVLTALNKEWKKYSPDYPFVYYFLDEKIDQFYKAEVRWSRIISWAGAISLLLACLGLFGLVSLAAVNRTREIGIRKVLGASILGIINLLAMDFLRLILVSFIIASIGGWWFMNRWLQGYAYRIDIPLWIFPVTGMLTVAIAFITISVQAIKAATIPPMKSLRSE